MGIIILKMALFVIQKVNLAQKCFLNHDNVNKWWDFWSLQWTHFTSVHVGIWPTSGLMRELFHRLENLYFCGHHKKNCHHWGYQQARIKKYIYFTLEKHYQDEHLNALSVIHSSLQHVPPTYVYVSIWGRTIATFQFCGLLVGNRP